MSSVIDRLQKLLIGKPENCVMIRSYAVAYDDSVLLVTSSHCTHLSSNVTPDSARITLMADRLIIDLWSTHAGMLSLEGSSPQLEAAAQYFEQRGFPLSYSS